MEVKNEEIKADIIGEKDLSLDKQEEQSPIEVKPSEEVIVIKEEEIIEAIKEEPSFAEELLKKTFEDKPINYEEEYKKLLRKI